MLGSLSEALESWALHSSGFKRGVCPLQGFPCCNCEFFFFCWLEQNKHMVYLEILVGKLIDEVRVEWCLSSFLEGVLIFFFFWQWTEVCPSKVKKANGKIRGSLTCRSRLILMEAIRPVPNYPEMVLLEMWMVKHCGPAFGGYWSNQGIQNATKKRKKCNLARKICCSWGLHSMCWGLCLKLIGQLEHFTTHLKVLINFCELPLSSNTHVKLLNSIKWVQFYLELA